MEKDLRYVELFELYQGLLTERQRELFRSHYYFDLSLAEIAEPDGNTRQNVYMAIKSVKKKLDEYEKLLNLKEKNQKLKAVAEKIKDEQPDVSKEILDIIGE
ncbi:MAG: RNA polymerase subunit sigma-70 [Clostridia bacterium]|nr:RNA polymerase subunit sigma-70 [Clostridia bacterium]